MVVLLDRFNNKILLICISYHSHIHPSIIYTGLSTLIPGQLSFNQQITVSIIFTTTCLTLAWKTNIATYLSKKYSAIKMNNRNNSLSVRKQSCRKVMFLHLSVSHSDTEGSLSLVPCSLWGSLPDRYPPDRDPSPLNRDPHVQWRVGGTHPTEMYSCFDLTCFDCVLTAFILSQWSFWWLVSMNKSQ